MSPTRWRSPAILALPFVLALVAGCATPATSAPVASAAAPVSPATSAPVASASGEPACQGTSVGLGGMLVTTNPNVTVALPRGWRAMSIAEYRASVVSFMAKVDDPGLTRAFEWELGEIDTGTIRGVARGISRPSCAAAVLFLTIQPTATNVDAAVAAWRAHTGQRGLSDKLVSTEPVQLPIGPVSRLTITLNPPRSELSQT